VLIRVGRVLYWVGISGSAVFSLASFYCAYVVATTTLEHDRREDYPMIFVFLVAAAVSWLIGKGLRYILSNE